MRHQSCSALMLCHLMNCQKRFPAAACIALVLAIPGVVGAAVLVFDDRLPNDQIAVFANDFELGLTINGQLFQQGLNNPASGGFSEQNPITFDGRWIDLGVDVPFSRTVYWVEPNTPTVISDILTWTVTSEGGGFGRIIGTFTSDFENNLGNLPVGLNPADVIVELPSGSHDPFLFTAAFFTGQVFTGPGEAIPEPASLGLLAAPAVMVLRRRRAISGPSSREPGRK